MKFLIVLLSFFVLAACSTSKKSSSNDVSFEDTAARICCDCIGDRIIMKNETYQVAFDSCFSKSFIQATQELGYPPNSIPYSGLEEMQTGMRLIKSKVEKQCGSL